ncbi:hypothetical protein HY641_02605 [Candidatus Woesearchaeota archaeon]|nr:hypothetical protein [Candidatus Woesearchaeota archaeon]
MIDEFKRQILRLRTTAFDLEQTNVDLSEDFGGNIIDYQDSRKEYLKRNYYSSLDALKTQAKHLHALSLHNSTNAKPVAAILEQIALIGNDKPAEIRKTLDKIWALAEALDVPDPKTADPKIPRFNPGVGVVPPAQPSPRPSAIKHLPAEVRGDLLADINEMEKCYNNGCHRSVTILCGRILETALHRKYYEVTGQDVLEKNPGIGLGNLIARLAEKNVSFDPGITNQIHLINQVRVFAVHKKQEPFYPTQAQAQAMMLYTMDVLAKLFAKDLE